MSTYSPATSLVHNLSSTAHAIPMSYVSTLSTSTSSHYISSDLVNDHNTQPIFSLYYQSFLPYWQCTYRSTFKPCSLLFFRLELIFPFTKLPNPWQISTVSHYVHLHLMRALHFGSLITYQLTSLPVYIDMSTISNAHLL